LELNYRTLSGHVETHHQVRRVSPRDQCRRAEANQDERDGTDFRCGGMQEWTDLHSERQLIFNSKSTNSAALSKNWNTVNKIVNFADARPEERK